MYTAKEDINIKDDENETAKIAFYIPKLLTQIALNDIERMQDDHDKTPVTNPQVDANDSSAPISTTSAAAVVVKMETMRSLLMEKNKYLDKMCRICHGGETKSEKLLTPCRCSGSTKYAHEKCLSQWLTIKQSRTCELCLYKIKVNRKGMKPFWKWRQPKYLCDLVASLILMYTLVMILFLAMVIWIASRQCVLPMCIALYCLAFLAIAYLCYSCSYVRCVKKFWRGFLDVNRQWSIEGHQASLMSDGDYESKV